MRRYVLAATLISTLIPMVRGSGQAAMSDEVKSLVGLRSLGVEMEEFAPEMIRDGVDTTGIRTKIELELRKQGIAVSDSARCYLHLSIDGIVSPQGLYSYSYDLDVRQPATINRLPALSMFATTWTFGGIVAVGKNNIRSSVTEMVQKVIDRFLNDWLTANPKKP